MRSATAALLALTIALGACSLKDLGIPDFPLGPPETKPCSLMDSPTCRVPVPEKRIAP